MVGGERYELGLGNSERSTLRMDDVQQCLVHYFWWMNGRSYLRKLGRRVVEPRREMLLHKD